MKSTGYVSLLLFLAMPLAADTIDVFFRNTLFLRTGDSVTFLLSSYNYSANARRYNQPAIPSRMDFELVTQPTDDSDSWFTAAVVSQDGSVRTDLPPLTFSEGTLHGSTYNGPVSVLEGSLDLPAEFGEEVFGAPQWQLVFTNSGPPATLGLPPYALAQDLFASLHGGGLNVGSLPLQVLWDSAPAPLMMTAAPAGPQEASAVPEPGSAVLLIGGGALLCAISGGLKRISHRRIQYISARKINCLQSGQPL